MIAIGVNKTGIVWINKNEGFGKTRFRITLKGNVATDKSDFAVNDCLMKAAIKLHLDKVKNGKVIIPDIKNMVYE